MKRTPLDYIMYGSIPPVTMPPGSQWDKSGPSGSGVGVLFRGYWGGEDQKILFVVLAKYAVSRFTQREEDCLISEKKICRVCNRLVRQEQNLKFKSCSFNCDKYKLFSSNLYRRLVRVIWSLTFNLNGLDRRYTVKFIHCYQWKKILSSVFLWTHATCKNPA